MKKFEETATGPAAASRQQASSAPQGQPSPGGLLETPAALGGIFVVTLMLWASAFVAIPIALHDVPPLSVIMGRLTISSVIFFPLIVIDRAKIIARFRHDWKLILVMGLTGTTGYLLALTFGQRTVGAGQTSLIVNMTPLITGLFAALLLKEAFHKRMFYGALICLLGVGFLVMREGETVTVDPNALLVLLAAASASLYYIIVRKLSRHYSAVTLSALTIVIGALATLPFAGNFVPGFAAMGRDSAYAIMFLGAVSGVLPYIGWNYILSKMPAGKAALYLYFIPVIATGLGWWLLDEAVTGGFVFAAALIILGVMIGTGTWKVLGLSERPRRAAPKIEPACKNAPGA